MKLTSEVSMDDEIDNPRRVRRHVVLLGAGASCAATPTGDASGRRLPVMANFVETLGLGQLLDRAGIEWSTKSFENLYSEIALDTARVALRGALEEAIESYFAALSLPDTPTTYDYLVLGLREKDVIATFNWDPFLIQALRRSKHVSESLPYLIFLHGCVNHGFCAQDQISGFRGGRCSKCSNEFAPDRLLFPIAKKNYSSSPGIAFAWSAVRKALKDSLMFTIFGYGAPKSDGDAVALLKSAWGGKKARQFEQIEIVDLRPRDELAESWAAFIHTHHYDVFSDFHDSFIAKHPRRSIEAFQNQYLDAKLIEDNSAPRGVDLATLHSWYERLVQAERSANV